MGRPFRHRIRVRYGECDPQGVVFNANWLAYFDVLITELWREAGCDYRDVLAAGTDMVVAECSVRFLGAAGFDDDVDFAVHVTRLGNTAVSTVIEARVGDDAVVEGEMRHVCIDPETKAKKPMPDQVRSALTPYAADATGAPMVEASG